MRSYKKTSMLLIILLILSLILSGCKYEVYKEGIENFDVNDSNISLNSCILPSDDFIENFDYTNGEYYYNDVNEHWLYVANCEQSIVILNYKTDVYEQAKAYCLDTMELSETNQFDYNGYTFTENIGLAKAWDDLEDGVNTRYPHHFNMFAYNDEEQCLVFMGFYSSPDNKDDNIYLAQTDWEEFLRTYFYEYYDFGNPASVSSDNSVKVYSD